MQDLYTDGFSMYLRLLVPIQFFVSIFIVDQENFYGKALSLFVVVKLHSQVILLDLTE